MRLLLFFYILLISYLIYSWYKEKPLQVTSVALFKNRSTIIHQKTVLSEPKVDKKPTGAIAILIGENYTKLALRLSSIDEHLLDNYENHVIIFHTAYPSSSDISRVFKATKRYVMFLNVDREFISFPTGFNPYSTDPTWSKRGKWNYHHMIRFWFKLIFELPELQQYDYIMRLDDDSQLLGTWFDVFSVMNQRNAVYFANKQLVDYEDGLPGTMKLKEICFTYKKTANISLEDPKRLESAFVRNTIKTYYNNFEVMKTHFFRRTDVRAWTDMIDATHGIYKYRWGDAILRYLTMVLFAKPEEILHIGNFNLSYCHPC